MKIKCDPAQGGCGQVFDPDAYLSTLWAASAARSTWPCPFGCGRHFPLDSVVKILAACGMDPDPPFVAHSATSRAAADGARFFSNKARARVYALLRRQGTTGATDEEMQTSLEMNPNTQRPRRTELVKAGLVVDSGVTRPTVSGRSATVWVAS